MEVVVSLDYELAWGNIDKQRDKDYAYASGSLRYIIEELESSSIKLIVAVVGSIFCRDLTEWKRVTEDITLPDYINTEAVHLDMKKNAENYFDGDLKNLMNEKSDILWSSHTFSHIFCLDINDDNCLLSDISLMEEIQDKIQVPITDYIIFPRNQYSAKYFEASKAKMWRRNQPYWIYSASSSREGYVKRVLRLLDNFLPLTKLSVRDPLTEQSLFLRFTKFHFLNYLQYLRIVCFTKKNDKVHLWFHPHNFDVRCTNHRRFLALIKKLDKS